MRRHCVATQIGYVLNRYIFLLCKMWLLSGREVYDSSCMQFLGDSRKGTGLMFFFANFLLRLLSFSYSFPCATPWLPQLWWINLKYSVMQNSWTIPWVRFHALCVVMMTPRTMSERTRDENLRNCWVVQGSWLREYRHYIWDCMCVHLLDGALIPWPLKILGDLCHGFFVSLSILMCTCGGCDYISGVGVLQHEMHFSVLEFSSNHFH